ncbi:FadR/GntR family transcriptional regulator [Amycolatopsis viridis]|uniref:DNA-binding FadR family transcriptional regulator n=1 Tax=Amycolatopsis viridis TaxID=185678 RepID=A0ABX0SQG8_9PSEU|nr:FadR/GntR family transcriptional regulator [Amycolatopsis viridis]NIH77601.1 DNA-binding FadR family transcriptional regulator [Amycolatopsis viridis]
MEFEPVSPVRAYERIVEQIEQAVLTGRLRPGERLPGERELMARFGVSRSTVREALRVLQSGEVIRSRPGDPRGPEVLPASPVSLQKSLDRLARAETLGLAELLQFRMILEGSAYRLAAELRTEEDLAELRTALATMTSTVDDYASFSRADVAFHDAVARAGRNTLIVVCGKVVRGVVQDLIAGKLESSSDREALMRASVAHHQEVLRAVEDGDGPLAARLARRALYDYYAEYVGAEDRVVLEHLLD